VDAVAGAVHGRDGRGAAGHSGSGARNGHGPAAGDAVDAAGPGGGGGRRGRRQGPLAQVGEGETGGEGVEARHFEEWRIDLFYVTQVGW
jgi:hypothetical protein